MDTAAVVLVALLCANILLHVVNLVFCIVIISCGSSGSLAEVWRLNSHVLLSRLMAGAHRSSIPLPFAWRGLFAHLAHFHSTGSLCTSPSFATDRLSNLR